MGKYNRTKVKVHPMSGIEIDTQTTRCLSHYIGIALVICAVGFLIGNINHIAGALPEIIRAMKE